jgi:TPR repeat protein
MKSKFIAAALALSSFAMFGSPAVAQEDAYAHGLAALEQGVQVPELEDCPLEQLSYGADDNVLQGLAFYAASDFLDAEKFFRLAAEQGNNEYAQFYLGVMYGNGQGVAQSDAEAVKWIRLAVEQGGLPEAMCTLGVAYAKGIWVPQNAAEAEKWLSRAADVGNPWTEFVTRQFPNMTPKQ